uniref:Receptor protein-tyrosine kinase n=1 Tax=Romanomermis culicivorax TaxID=13658 RepID=A0A915I050_ROMCU
MYKDIVYLLAVCSLWKLSSNEESIEPINQRPVIRHKGLVVNAQNIRRSYGSSIQLSCAAEYDIQWVLPNNSPQRGKKACSYGNGVTDYASYIPPDKYRLGIKKRFGKDNRYRTDLILDRLEPEDTGFYKCVRSTHWPNSAKNDENAIFESEAGLQEGESYVYVFVSGSDSLFGRNLLMKVEKFLRDIAPVVVKITPDNDTLESQSFKGNTIVINCSTEVQHGDCNWTLPTSSDNDQARISSTYEMLGHHYTRILKIVSLNEDDAGIYYCYCTNSMHSVTNHDHINLRVRTTEAHVSILDSSNAVLVGSTPYLELFVNYEYFIPSHRPANKMRVSWTQDQTTTENGRILRVLSSNDVNVIKRAGVRPPFLINSTIAYISPVDKSSSGKYTANISVYDDFATKSFDVFASFGPEIKLFLNESGDILLKGQIDVDNTNLEEHRRYTVYCIGEGYPIPNITLEFSPCVSNDEKNCRDINYAEHFNRNLLSPKSLLYVVNDFTYSEEHPGIDISRVGARINESIFYTGSPLSLSCSVQKYFVTLNLEWVFKPIHTDAVMEISRFPKLNFSFDNILEQSVLSNKLILNVPKLELAHSGIYICIWKYKNRNNILEKSHSMAVNVTPSKMPFFGPLSTEEHLLANYSSEQNIFCDAFGEPTPNISWYKDDVQLDFESKHGVFLSTDNKTLTIGRTVEIDAGKRQLADLYRGLMSSSDYKPKIDPAKPINYQIENLPYDFRYEIPIQYLKLGKILGEGQFGKFYLDNSQLDFGFLYCSTSENGMDVEHQNALISELKMMIYIESHVNVLSLVGAVTKRMAHGQLYVLVEYCKLGSLGEFLKNHRATFVDELVAAAATDLKEDPTQRYLDITSLVNQNESAGEKDRLIEDEGYLAPAQVFGTTKSDRTKYQGEIDEQWSLELSQNKLSKTFICTSDLLSYSYQIANGMEYLASKNLLHRDLAARNLLLTDNHVVKICDFGLARHDENYQIKKLDVPLPVRWMALESILDQEYTKIPPFFNNLNEALFRAPSPFACEKAFILARYADRHYKKSLPTEKLTFSLSFRARWSFGIVLWEIFALGELPYSGQEINRSFIQWLKAGNRLERPRNSPKEIDVMIATFNDPRYKDNFFKKAGTVSDIVETLKTLVSNLNDQSQIIISMPAKKQKK